jgi:hypothetical protein
LLLLGVTSVQLGAVPDPTVEFLKPQDGSALADESALIEVSYTGSAEHPVVHVEVYVEGGGPHFVYKPPQPQARGTCSFSWALARVQPGQYRLRARATDSAGRVGSASVTVSVLASEERGPRQPRPEQLRPRLPGVQPQIEAFRRHGQELPPELLERGALWSPVDPPIPRGAVRRYFGPQLGSSCWYPVNPPRPVGKPPAWGEMGIVPEPNGGIIIPPGRELQDVWPRIIPKGGGEYEFRLPDGRGRGTIRIVPPGGRDKKAPEKQPEENDAAPKAPE